MKLLKKIKLKLNAWKKLLIAYVFAYWRTLFYVSAGLIPLYPAAIDTSTITEWLPVIIEFAMLGMIMSLLKKFGKW